MYRFSKLIALAFSQAILVAQTSNPAPKTPIASIPAVRAMMELAKENNPDYALAQSRTHEEYARIGPAGALPDPQVNFAVAKTPSNHVTISGEQGLDTSHLFGTLPGMTEYSMSLGQSLPWPGKRAARENIAHQGVKRSEIGIHETILALETNVLTSSLELLVIQARRDLLASQLNYWAAMEEAIKARMDQGGSSASDAIQAMQEQARLKLRLLEADSQIQDQKDILNQLIARDQNTPIELDAEILKLMLPEPPEANELLDDLKSRNPEWLGTQIDLQSANASIHSANMERFPDFRVGAGLARAGSMPLAWRLEAGVGLPIWSKRKQNKVVARARAERNSTESVQAGLALILATKSRERARAWKLADTTAKLYATELIPQGEAALEILIARFQNGGASFGSLVEALNALLKDHEQHLEAIAQIHRIAILQHGASLDGTSGTGIKTASSSGSVAMDSGAM